MLLLHHFNGTSHPHPLDSPLASFKMKETQMPLTSNCCSAAFPLRERGLLAPCGSRTNENQMRESGESRQSTREEATKLRPQRRSRGILISSEVEQSPPTQHTHTLLCMTESCLGMRCVCVCACMRVHFIWHAIQQLLHHLRLSALWE